MMPVVLGAGGVSWLPIICLLRLEAPKDINTSTGTGLKRQGAMVSCDRSAVLVRVHSSWLQVELNFCLFVKMNRTASGCRRHFPRKLLLSHLLIARRLILFFFLPKTKAHFSRLAVSLTFSFRDNAELLLGTSGYDGVILRWSTGAKEIKVCCGNLHAKHPGIFPPLSENITRKSSIVSEWCAPYAVEKSSYEMLFSF